MKDDSDTGGRSHFVDFVEAVTDELRARIPSAALGTAIHNFLYAPSARTASNQDVVKVPGRRKRRSRKNAGKPAFERKSTNRPGSDNC